MILKDQIEALTQQERYELLGQLVRLHVGAIRLDETSDDWCVIFRSNGKIAPGCSEAVCAAPHIRFRPRKLVISEPMIDIFERETTYATKVIGPWWKQRKINDIERVREHRREILQTRSIWTVQSVFIGNKPQFPSYSGINGDEFGPFGDLPFPDVCDFAFTITLVAQNTSLRPAEFFAVLVGKNEQNQAAEDCCP